MHYTLHKDNSNNTDKVMLVHLILIAFFFVTTHLSFLNYIMIIFHTLLFDLLCCALLDFNLDSYVYHVVDYHSDNILKPICDNSKK